MVAHQLAGHVVHALAAAPQPTGSNNNNGSSNSISSSNASVSAAHVAARHYGSLSDAEAREWWTQREAKVERELYTGLQKRMETQRKQVHAFKLEQAKWENELQLKIKKFAHDRKLLSEHNIELQEALTSLEEKFAKQQSEMDSQTTQIVALESLLREKTIETQELEQLRLKNEELSQCVAQWERFHRADAAAAEQTRKLEQQELLNHLERTLLATSLQEDTTAAVNATSSAAKSSSGQSAPCSEKLGRRRSAPDGSALRKSGCGTNEDTLNAKVVELEKLCKQKDQSINSLKSVVDQQESVFGEKVKILTAKYDQVKAINLALQKRLLNTLTDDAINP